MVSRRDLDALRAECGQLEALVKQRRRQLNMLGRRRSELTVRLMPVGTDSARLPLAPLICTLAATVLALGATFVTYLICVLASSNDSDLPTATLVAAALLASASLTLRFGYRPGAGGHARRVLQPTAFTLIIGSFATAVAVLLLHALR